MESVDLRRMRYFVVLAEELHVGRAAARLSISQPALSRRIAELERATDVLLFERTSRGVVLTGAGQAFLPPARAALRAVDAAVDAARRAGRGETGLLRIGYAGSAANGLLPRVLRRFRDEHPGVALELVESFDDQQMSAAVARGELDAAFQRLPQPGGVRLHPLAREPLAAVLPADHPRAGASELHLAELAGAPFLLWPRTASPASYDEVVAACARAGFSPRVVQEASSAQAVLGLVAAGFGVALLALSHRSLRRDGVALVPVVGEEATMTLVTGYRPAGPLLERLVHVSRQVAGTGPAGRSGRRAGA